MAENESVDNGWEVDENEGGFEKVVFQTGSYFGRVRAAVACGSVVHEFQGKPDKKPTSTLALVIELHDIQEDDEEELFVASEEPAILEAVIKLTKNEGKANYEKWLKALGAANPGEFIDAVAEFEVYTSDKGYMYMRGAPTKAGRAEKKVVPKLSEEGIAVSSLAQMTEEAVLCLNPIIQVKEFMMRSVGYEGSQAEEVIEEIRKENPEFAKLKKKDEKEEEEKPKGKGKSKSKGTEKPSEPEPPTDKLDEEEEF